MAQINLKEEVLKLEKAGVNLGIATYFGQSLSNYFKLYGAERIMMEKNSFDKALVDMHLQQLFLKLFKVDYSKQIQEMLDENYTKVKNTYEYYLKSIMVVDLTLKDLDI